jgi:hypothetical protein
MNPTFRVPDVLHVEPCTDGRVRPGDVIVFADPHGRGNVVHRVISVLEGGAVRTQGDGNELMDAYVMPSSGIVGRVTHATRNGKRRAVRGGFYGRLVGASSRLYGSARVRLMQVLRPAYVAWSGCLAFPWLVRKMNIRIVQYTREGKVSELHLLMGSRCVGRLLPNQTRWHITPPFRLLVDETSHPEFFPRTLLTICKPCQPTANGESSGAKKTDSAANSA